ncbi:MAG: family 16 glycosylhydrolase, partial [Bacteroidota bacterium]
NKRLPMNILTRFLCIILLSFLFLNCEDNPEPQPPAELPKLRMQDSQVFEKEGNSQMIFEARLDEAAPADISINYTVEGISAEPGVDFETASGTLTIATGESKAEISVQILDDSQKEVDEKIRLTISGGTDVNIVATEGIGLIKDNEEVAYTAQDGGYESSETHFGYNLVWNEEFDGSALSTDVYNFELDDGCPNLCGWGNSELQWYTDLPQNVKVEDSKLIITATKQGASGFKSARIQTKGKKEFKFGRIDVRARLPKGQGIWPAIWMLGANIDEVGWPACGEIDIMELVGHQASSSHGTAHWGAQGDPGSTSSTAVYGIDEDFAERFHVFSIVWEEDEIVWYVDESRFHQVGRADMRGKPYPFNQEMFFIMNIAVGGLWPGSPDETTIFPQTMEIDYLRVFQ